jgi:tetratricopeptide (TPR) repeat protein
LDICREISFRLYHGVSYVRLGTVAGQWGEYALALEHYNQGIQILREIDTFDELMQALPLVGLLHYLSGDYAAALKCNQEALAMTERVKNKRDRARVLASQIQGHLLREVGEFSSAGESYQRALTLALEMGLQHYVKQAQTGLAAIALAQGNLSEALAPMDEILHYLQTTPVLSTIDEVPWVYLTCYRILQAANDPRARSTLEAGYNFIQQIAARIDDERLRTSFLQNVRFNREIVEAWEGLQT